MPHVNERRDEERVPDGRRDPAAPGRPDADAGGPVQPAGGQRVDPSTDDPGLAAGEGTDGAEIPDA